MSSPAREIGDCPPASLVLERLLQALPKDRVSVGWLHNELHEHSFEMLAFIMALIGVLPGASVMVGILMAVPALGMMFSRGLRLPDMVAERSISTRQASYVLGRAIPLLRSWEGAGRSSRARGWKLIRPLVGFVTLILSFTLLVPVPLSNVIPALVIAGLSLASFEENATLLWFSLSAAAVSVAITAVTILAASQAFANFAA